MTAQSSHGYHGVDQSESTLVKEAQRVGLPLLIKAVSEGGGKGGDCALVIGRVLDLTCQRQVRDRELRQERSRLAREVH